MKVILLENVKTLGLKGAVVEVAEGYARNFLFPQHRAVEASDQTLRAVEEREKAAGKKSKKADQEEKKAAKALDGMEVIISVKTDGGKLYAAIGPKEVSIAIKQQGQKISADLIEFEPVKDLGSFEAVVNFKSGFEATVTVVVEEK